ncbi:MAG: hypothetical protein HC779_03425 [Phyllobacteriaceae bacterium]|nr:hypothetical protein [Phyllobacteriaceae bacterium]
MAPAGGTGRFDEALAWGWRLVSPKWRGEFGETAWPAKAGETRKLVVLFTDAHTTANEHEIGKTPSNLGWNNGSTQMFETMDDQCTRMKKSGVDVMIFHVLGNVKGQPYMKQCATENMYYGVKNKEDLIAAVKKATVMGNGAPRLIY